MSTHTQHTHPALSRLLTIGTFAVIALLTIFFFATGATIAKASAKRELITSFGDIEAPAGIAVDLETGNVYITDNKTWTVKIFGPSGGSPVGHVPNEITGVHLALPEKINEFPGGIAVDNSCYEHQPRLTGKACEEYDPSYGDVYVINSNENEDGFFLGGVKGLQKFELGSNGSYELSEEIRSPLNGSHESIPNGVAIESHGNIFIDGVFAPEIFELKKNVEKTINDGVEEFKETLQPIAIEQNIVAVSKLRLGPGYIAADGSGDLYIGKEWEESGDPEDKGLAKIRVGSNGEVVSEEVFVGPLGGVPRPVAVDGATGTVFVGDGQEIAEYSPTGELQLMFGSMESLGGSLGKHHNGVRALAVNSATGTVYAVNPLHDDVDAFGPAVGPPVFSVEQPAVSDVSRTGAALAGTVDAESGNASYYFEYAAEAEYAPGASNPYAQGGRTPIGALTGGHKAETIEGVAIGGLRPGTTYRYRMVASNGTATVYGPGETFTTSPATPPGVGSGPAVEVSATSAVLTGVVAPRGLATSYVFEVGTDTGYEGARLFGDAGSSTGEVPVSVELEYLIPGTTYHFRLTATSFDGTSYGQDVTFTTPGASSPLVAPASAPLIEGGSAVFPSIAGAIRKPVGKAKAKTRHKQTGSPLRRALRECRGRSGRARARCQARARKRYGPVGAKHSKKR